MPTSVFVFTTLSLIIMLASSILSKKTMKDREKSSPFECGFDPKNSARTPFSLRFFLVAVIFLIFDIEIVLLIPFPQLLKSLQSTYSIFIVLTIILILVLGLIYEWVTNALDWAN